MLQLTQWSCCFFSLMIPVFGAISAEPEQINGGLGDIITNPRAPATQNLRNSTDSAGPGGFGIPLGGLNIRPYYMHTVTLGSDAGGNRDEYREQSRGRTRLRAGVGVEADFGHWIVGGSLGIRGEIDRRRFNSSESKHFQTLRTGNSFLFLGYRGEPRSSYDTYWRNSVFMRPVLTTKTHALLRIGRYGQSITPEGLLFQGDAPSAGMDLVFRRSSDTAFSFGLMALQLDREERVPYRPNGSSFFGGMMTGLHGPGWSVVLFGGFYRSPGRAAEPDLTLPGFPGTLVILPTGQTARPDLDVRYYGLRYQQKFRSHDWRTGIYTNSGRSIAVDRSGIRQGLTRKGIRGTLLHASWRIGLKDFPDRSDKSGGSGRPLGKCQSRLPASGTCITNRPLKGLWELEISLLASSRDRDETDGSMRGFGSLRPAPTIMGGLASILLNGPALGEERPVARNQQPGRPFSDGQVPRMDPDEVRDNLDPAPPDYENQGLNLGSVRLGHEPLPGLRVDGFLNYGDFLRGDALELIFGLQWRPAWWARIFCGVTGAWYRPAEREIDPLTGLSTKSARRFYSRYVVGAAVSF